MTTERIELVPGLSICRVVTGLWQVADLEQHGEMDPAISSHHMQPYVNAGLTSFDMADHYGSAEKIVGAYNGTGRRGTIQVLTKVCPPAGDVSREDVRAAVKLACSRLQTETIDLLQLHTWSYRYESSWLSTLEHLMELQNEGVIRALGLTNFDTQHLRVVLSAGLRVATNQVAFSLLDARPLEGMCELCEEYGVRLLCYGVLGGGYLTDRALEDEPSRDSWSLQKYGRFLDAAGGYERLQPVLRAARVVADKHGVSIANVACRWVMQQPAVGAVIVGARLGRSEHVNETLQTFCFRLGDDDLALLNEARNGLLRVHAGDCGDEYRRPPFLTASGDLSHHVACFPPALPVEEHQDGSASINTGTTWERIAGFARAVRTPNGEVHVSGTTATDSSGECVAPGDAAAQTCFILDKIEAAITSLGCTNGLADVYRTRIYVSEPEYWEAAARAHGERFLALSGRLPANTLVVVGIIGVTMGYVVEIEADAGIPRGTAS